jgi:hypothetical protein
MDRNPSTSMEDLLQQALERVYQAEPRRLVFASSAVPEAPDGTSPGSGNAIGSEPGGVAEPETYYWYIPRSLTLRTALVQSSNRVFVGLMRDLIQYHAARLPYDAHAAITNLDDPLRRSILQESADQEARYVLKRSHASFGAQGEQELVRAVLGGYVSARRAAVLYYAWHGDADEGKLAAWLARHVAPGTLGAGVDATNAVRRLARAYSNPRLTLADYGYLLDMHPLEIWSAGQLLRNPDLSFDELLARAGEATTISSAWLFKTRNRKAQDRRVWRRIERDAFEHMTPYWRHMGFPFEQLVPSLTTALGSSADRPAALAELMGIILNDGLRRPSVVIEKLRFADGTPYHSGFRFQPQEPERVLQPAVARLLRDVLAQVVENGTARKVKAAISGPDGAPALIGGKTGTDSGESSYEVVAHGSQGRTASFAFYVGERYFGVITASVAGPSAADYRFTSELPLAVLRQLAPLIEQRLAAGALLPTLMAAAGNGRSARVPGAAAAPRQARN